METGRSWKCFKSEFNSLLLACTRLSVPAVARRVWVWEVWEKHNLVPRAFGKALSKRSYDSTGVRHFLSSFLTSSLLTRYRFFYGFKLTMFSHLSRVEQDFDSEGLDVLSPRILLGSYSRPRLQEIAATINRLRVLAMK